MAHFSPNEIAMVLQAYKGCPYFALMSGAEFEGTIFEESPLVMELYPKTSQKDAVAPFLLHQIHSFLCQSDLDSAAFALQLTGRFKLRLGLRSQEEGIKWFDSVRYDMDALGILFKDESTNKRISELLEASYSESSASSKSSAAPYRPGPIDQDNMVLYDVPVWMEDEQVMEAFRAKDKPPTAVYRLNGTPGDIALAAWKLVGAKLKELHGAIVRDPNRTQPMYIVTMDHYVQERTTQHQKSQTRTKPKPVPKGHG